MQSRVMNRLLKEKMLVTKQEEFTLEIQENNQLTWCVTFECPEGSIYKGEKYTLKFVFPINYVFLKSQ